MHGFVSLGLSILFIFGLFTPASAHNGWSQTNTPLIKTGQKSYVELQFGNHSDDHTSYRIDRKWGMEDSIVSVFYPSGEKKKLQIAFFIRAKLPKLMRKELG